MMILMRTALACILGIITVLVVLAFIIKGQKGDAIAWGLFLGFITSAVCPPESELQIIIRVFTERD